MGEESGWNRLELRAGAFLSASNAYFGSGFSEWTGNVVEVSGPGTIWTNTGDVSLNGNALMVSNNATVYSRGVDVAGGA